MEVSRGREKEMEVIASGVTTLRYLEFIAQNGTVTTDQLQGQFPEDGYMKVRRYVQTLQAEGWITKDGEFISLGLKGYQLPRLYLELKLKRIESTVKDFRETHRRIFSIGEEDGQEK